jgi:hypothetical protein
MPSADCHAHIYLSKSLEKAVIKKHCVLLALLTIVFFHYYLAFSVETPATPGYQRAVLTDALAYYDKTGIRHAVWVFCFFVVLRYFANYRVYIASLVSLDFCLLG